MKSGLAGVVSLCLYALLCAPTFAAQVTVEARAGVDSAAQAVVKQGIKTTLQVFQDTFGLVLDHDVTVILTADKQSYIHSLIEDDHLRPDYAEKRGRTSSGMSKYNTIIEDLGSQQTDIRKVSVIGHELTHQFQAQVSGGKHRKIRWLTEGSAECVAALVTERMGMATVEKYRALWVRNLKKKGEWPRLSDLNSWKDWSAAEDRYGGRVLYNLGGLAVLRLTDLRGQRAVFDYFKRLESMPAPRAFRESFGMELSTFESGFSF